jgi:crotonobetainyl-CoA:carnitine CoA-transferase CaiB-like acyl-CoA transferase
MARLGLGYEELSKTNAKLIYASISGYGQTGPYRDRKGQDIMAQGLSGITWLNGARDDPPTLVGMPMADFTAAMLLCQGILIALHARARSGKGQQIETSLLNAMLFPQLQDIQLYINTRAIPLRPPRGGSRPNHGPTAGVFRAKDGYVVATVVFDTGSLVSGMCRILGLPDLGLDPRFNTREKALEHFKELHGIFEAQFATKTVAEWVEVFEKADAMCVPAYTYREVCEDPQVLHNEMIVEVEHPKGGKMKTLGNPLKMYGTPWNVRNGPPELGAQTDEILSELSLSMDQIADLRQRRVVG